ncbi:LysR family transcriptional regulator [Thalassotalea sp. M1531]|uniref:LysR family transcriptional regulator n=1 Tax=Thalassotalea algicola TaxID=2716224 RepID=A0A7Y0LBM6_9GAMM|nr:LysR family transcriptional regulator [Thalassotalea algicola]NMP31152.1 LysR family transcriptional regulator [Thalassotalea algicola]
MLNPVWLNTFVMLIDIGHFTKTAEKLFMTQPGVSQHIAKLEAACGHSLIKRDKKSFELTEQGRLVYLYGKKLVEHEQTLLEQLTFDDPYNGDCTLACSGSLALALYPKLLTLQTQYPKLVIKLKSAPNHQILSEIQQGSIDVGIVTDSPNKALYDVKEVAREELCLILPKSAVVTDDIGGLISELGLISHPDAEHYLSLYFAQSQEKSFAKTSIKSMPITGYINQISQILMPVAQGLGFTVLPKSAFDAFTRSEQIQIFTPEQPVIETLYKIKRKNRQLPARYQILEPIIQSALVSV